MACNLSMTCESLKAVFSDLRVRCLTVPGAPVNADTSNFSEIGGVGHGFSESGVCSCRCAAACFALWLAVRDSCDRDGDNGLFWRLGLAAFSFWASFSKTSIDDSVKEEISEHATYVFL